MRRTVHIRYFALLREQAGRADEKVETTAAKLTALYAELRARHGLGLPAARVRVAVNGEFAEWDTPLAGGAQIAFLPPVAGG